jgi:hypothetical protein
VRGVAPGHLVRVLAQHVVLFDLVGYHPVRVDRGTEYEISSFSLDLNVAIAASYLLEPS